MFGVCAAVIKLQLSDDVVYSVHLQSTSCGTTRQHQVLEIEKRKQNTEAHQKL